MPISRNSTLFPFSSKVRTPESELVVKELEQIVEYFRREVDIAFQQLAVVQDGINAATQSALNLKANLASPNFTGVPTAPTAELDTNTVQIATTQYVINQGYLKEVDAVTLFAPLVHTHLWSQVTVTPTTLAGYGITDAAPLTHVGAGGTAHANATISVSGFMSAADKSTFDDLVIEFQSLVMSLNPIATSGSYGDLSGVPTKLVNLAAGTVGASLEFTGDTLNTIQGIRTTDTPQFARLGIGVAAHASVPLRVSRITSNLPTPDTDTQVHVVTNTGEPNFYQADTFGSFGGLLFRRANGIPGTPTAVASNDLLGFVASGGYHSGAAYDNNRVAIFLYADEAWTATARGTRLDFFTTMKGGISFGTVAMRLTHDKNLLIGTSSETGLTGPGGLKVGSTIASTSSTTGSAVFGGGIGVGGNSFFDGIIAVETQNVAATLQLRAASSIGGAFTVLDCFPARNTIGTPNAVQDGDGLLIRLQTHDGSNYVQSAAIHARAAENHSGSARGTFIVMFTTSLGSTTMLERIRVSREGNLLVGTNSDFGLTGAGNLKVAGALMFGTDTNLYRSAANVLTTDDTIRALAYRDNNGVKVVGTQGGAISDPLAIPSMSGGDLTNVANLSGALNDLRAKIMSALGALRAHGLIAT